MTPDLAAAAAAALLCGVGGFGVRPLIAWVPEPVADPADDVDRAKPTYAAVAGAPGLTLRSVLLAVLAGALIGATLGWAWSLLVLLPMVPVAVALAEIDRRSSLLPVAIVWPALATLLLLGVAASLLDQDLAVLLRALLAAAAVFAFFYLLWRIRAAGMGYGDVRVSAGIGFALGYLGWAQVVVGVYAAFVTFGVLGLARATWRRDRALLKVAVPFGPALLGGALIGVVLAEPVWHLVAG